MVLVKTCSASDCDEKSGIHDSLSPQDLLFQRGLLVKGVKISSG